MRRSLRHPKSDGWTHPLTLDLFTQFFPLFRGLHRFFPFAEFFIFYTNLVCCQQNLFGRDSKVEMSPQDLGGEKREPLNLPLPGSKDSIRRGKNNCGKKPGVFVREGTGYGK